jgi:hypothetical protein
MNRRIISHSCSAQVRLEKDSFEMDSLTSSPVFCFVKQEHYVHYYKTKSRVLGDIHQLILIHIPSRKRNQYRSRTRSRFPNLSPKMCYVDTFLFHFRCGHQTFQTRSEKCVNTSGCINGQPHHYTAVSTLCPSCQEGNPRLQSDERRSAKAIFQRLQAEEEEFRSELNMKNEPEEKYLCSLDPRSFDFSITEAVRLQELRGNLEKVLKYYLGDAHNELKARRDRLDEAIANVPDKVAEGFSNNEILTQAEILDAAALRTGNNGHLDKVSYLANILQEFAWAFGISQKDIDRAAALKLPCRFSH